MNPSPYRGSIGQPRLPTPLAVDQLQHAQNFALAVFHRKRDQRTRAVAGPLIERRIKMKRPRLWYTVRVGKLDYLTVKRAIPGHGFLRERERVLAEGKLHAVVLRQLKAQAVRMRSALRRSRVTLHEIQRSAVSSGNLSRFLQDQVEKLFHIPRFRKRNADAVQLFKLPRGMRGAERCALALASMPGS